MVPSAVAGTGSTDDLLFPKGPPTQLEVTDAAILKNSVAILTHQLAQTSHYRRRLNCANVAKFTLCGCPAPTAAVFRRPYARTTERLLDGTHTGQQPFNGTPDTLHQLLTNAASS